jgi:metal-responsive CopG/Arc/MetJ family transcriptional regulator
MVLRYDEVMKRITVSLPEEAAQRLEREARRRGVSISALVREAVEGHFVASDGDAHRLPFVGAGRSGHRHTARDAEEILEQGFGDDRGR